MVWRISGHMRKKLHAKKLNELLFRCSFKCSTLSDSSVLRKKTTHLFWGNNPPYTAHICTVSRFVYSTTLITLQVCGYENNVINNNNATLFYLGMTRSFHLRASWWWCCCCYLTSETAYNLLFPFQYESAILYRGCRTCLCLYVCSSSRFYLFWCSAYRGDAQIFTILKM